GAAMAGGGGPAARELFAEGLLQFLRPAVRQLDGHVHAVRSGREGRPPGGGGKGREREVRPGRGVAGGVKGKLRGMRRGWKSQASCFPAQERLRRLNHSVAKETVRRKAMLEAAGGYPQGLPGK
ncbi:SNAPN protein, partial [Alcedo cyanopectus]|nr:SNAPN protein [Ceyx cyanopectus]